jgi:putative transcriptional regulator
MPTLHDVNFKKTLTLICEHSAEQGAMGIILNQPTSLSIHELLNIKSPAEEEESLPAIHIHSGGPVDTDHGFILHDSHAEYDSTIQVTDNLFLTSSTDILEDIANGIGPNNTLIVLGYAGWAAGQLENEISANSWITIDYQEKLVFSTPAEQQWLAAGNILGIDLNLMSSQAGHA